MSDRPPTREAAPGERGPLALFSAWIFASALGESAGMMASALFGAAAPAAVGSIGPWQSELLVVTGGLIEGAFLGSAQSLVINHVHPRIAPWKWAVATMSGMTLGWTLGTHVDDPFRLDGTVDGPVLVLTVGAVLGIVLGAVLGLAQALLLRSERPARGWILASAAGWGAGMIVTFFGNAAIPASEWTAGLFLRVAATGAATGAVVGAATGISLVVGYTVSRT